MRIDSTPPPVSAVKKDDPARIAAAAKQFEALLIGQMLKSVAESSSEGWMGSGSQSGSSAIELAQEQFANALSANGGLGLEKVIVQSLTKPEVTRQPAVPHALL